MWHLIDYVLMKSFLIWNIIFLFSGKFFVHEYANVTLNILQIFWVHTTHSEDHFLEVLKVLIATKQIVLNSL